MKKLITFFLCTFSLFSFSIVSFASENLRPLPDLPSGIVFGEYSIWISAGRTSGKDSSGNYTANIYESTYVTCDFPLFAYLSGQYINVGVVIPLEDGSYTFDKIGALSATLPKEAFAHSYWDYSSVNVTSGKETTNSLTKEHSESGFNLHKSLSFVNADGSDGSYSSSGYFFDSLDSAKSYYLEGNKDGLIFEPVPEGQENISDDMPVPIISRNNQTDLCTFINGSDEYTVEIKGRWWTVDDVFSYKEALMWKHKYDTLLKNDLSFWVTANDNFYANQSFNPNSIGKNSFDNLLALYPINSRSYTGGTNAVGNYFSGYSDALANFKLLLGASSSSFNSWEIYARYRYVKPDGSIIYSKWAHMYTGLADPKGSSGSDWDDGENNRQEYQNNEGLGDDDIFKLENKNSRDDPYAIPKVNFDKDWSDSVEGLVNTSNQIFSLFSGLFGLMGSVPNMIASVFGFLPSWFISFLSISLGLVVLMRFVGR